MIADLAQRGVDLRRRRKLLDERSCAVLVDDAGSFPLFRDGVFDVAEEKYERLLPAWGQCDVDAVRCDGRPPARDRIPGLPAGDDPGSCMPL